MLVIESMNSLRFRYTLYSTLATFFGYYCPGWFYVLADWYGFLEPYAIRKGSKRLPSLRQQYAAIVQATVDCFLIKPVLFWCLYPYVGQPFINFDPSPDISINIKEVLYMMCIFSFSFYVVHRLFHNIPFLYKNVHKIHHTYHETVGFAAQWAHIVEEISSGFHTVIAVSLVRPYFSSWIMYFFLTLVEIVDAHSGYSVPWRFLYPWSDVYPWGSGARIHDFHYSHNVGTYGGGLISFDKIFGTDRAYKEWNLLHSLEVDDAHRGKKFTRKKADKNKKSAR